jgi:hypothetical protein
LTWQRLSVREGQAKDDGPYENVPPHLSGPLRHWVDRVFGGVLGSFADSRGGPRLVAAIRYQVPLGTDKRLTVRSVTEAVAVFKPEFMLDIVDAVLHFEEVDPRDCEDLDELLVLGGSVWQVDSSGRRLVRRVDATTTAAFADASSPSDMAKDLQWRGLLTW